MAALSVVVLYIASVLPILKLAVCLVASAIVCITMMKYGARGALVLYLATSVVSIIISPDKTVAFGYLLFFGNYPIIKAFIENIHNLKAEWIVKIILFSAYTVIAFMAMTIFFSGVINFPYSKIFIFVAAVAAAAVYDVALSLFISEISKRFSKLFF
ncbi:MAG: hypothetical protein IJN62_01220 [Clostridia bacterium]|nr:hypothetical protein [Clostridia bacterium]